MACLPAIVSVAAGACLPSTVRWPSSSSSVPSVVGACTAVGRARALTKDSILYLLEHEELFNSPEVVQWESGMSYNSIAAAQGIRVRRLCRTRYPCSSEEPDAVPRSTLERIIWDKEVEVYQRKAATPLEEVMDAAQRATPPRDFVGALLAARRSNHKSAPAVIAEVKKASPGTGVPWEHFDLVEIARAYEKNGATCLSIVTDERHFQGSFEDLERVRNSGVKCPLLCKEFIIHSWQIYHARSKGADAVVLIAAVLTNLDIKYMLRICNSLGMAALVEVRDVWELDRVLKINGVQLIGINNHNLEISQVDIAKTKMLLETHGDIIRKRGILVMTESGILTPEGVAYVHNAGVWAVLAGESLVMKEDPGRATAALFGKDLVH